MKNTLNSFLANGKQSQPTQNLTPSSRDEEDDEISLSLPQIKFWLRRRGLLVGSIFFAVSVSSTFYAFTKPPVYQESFNLLIEAPQETPVGIPGIDSSLINMSGLSSANESYVLTQIEVLSGYELISRVLEKIEKVYPPETEKDVIKYQNFIQNKIKITNPKETNIITVSYKDKDPKKVKFVLEALANIYIDHSLKEPRKRKGQGLDFVEKQLPEMEFKVAEIQKKLELFRRKNNIIDPQSQGQMLTSNLTELTQKQQENQAQLYQAQIRYQNLKQQLGMEEQDALMLAALSESPRYMSLLEKLREVDTKLAAESTRFTEENPAIKKLYQERRNLLPLIAEEAKAVLGNVPEGVPIDLINLASPNRIRLDLLSELLKAETTIGEEQVRSRELMKTKGEMLLQIDNLAQVMREYVDLTRKLEIANANLTRYLATQQELELEIAKTISPWRLVSEIRTPEEPISSPLKLAVLGTFAGLMLGIGAGLLAEKLNDGFHSANELKEKTRLPLLGTILLQKQDLRGKNTKLLMNDPDFPIFLEAFYFFHTNLVLLDSEKPLRSVTITSAIPGEGKSTIAAYLAQTAAQIGQKVLLVDGDLRLPQLQNHPGLTASNKYSLEDVLDDGLDPEKAITVSPLHKNLHVLAGNSKCRKPSALLGSELFSKLIEQWEKNFDLVIVDSPPLVGLSDTKLIATNTDGLILVVRLDKTTKDLVQDALEEIKSARLPLLGLVANGAKQDTLKTNDYYQQYQRYYQQI